MANKNILMLKSFVKVMKNEEEEIKVVLPKMYAEDVFQINYEFLKNKKLTNLIFDIDNTILPVGDIKVPEELINLFKTLEKDFNICLMSNNVKERVLPVAEILETSYLFDAGKPLKESFDNALNLLKSKKENTVMIGDQMLSDIKGANMYGLYTVMVDPVSTKHDIKTGVSRILQKIMMKKLTKKGIFKEKNYYEKEW